MAEWAGLRIDAATACSVVSGRHRQRLDGPGVRAYAAGGACPRAEFVSLAFEVGAIAVIATWALGGHFPDEVLRENREVLAVKGWRPRTGFSPKGHLRADRLVMARSPLLILAYERAISPGCRAAHLDGAA